MLIRGGAAFIRGQFIKTNVRISGGRIAETGELTPHAGETVHEAEGLFVLPGFVDIHIHAFAGHDCMRGESDVRAMSRDLAKTGVAAFVPTTMSAGEEATRKALAGIQAVVNAPEPGGADVLGAHMEAPFLSSKHMGAQLGDCLVAPSMDAYARMTRGIDTVRMMTIAPELPGALDMIRALHAQHIITCAAHSDATAEQVHAAADAGLSQITHLFNAQTPLHHRAPGVPGAGLADARITTQIIADCIHLHPDVLRIAALCKGAQGAALITDAMEAAGLPDGVYDLGGQAVYVREGAARLANGTLAGSTLTMHQAVKNMITRAGIAPEIAVPMATSTPAESIGARTCGRIQPGHKGILALMDQQWNFVAAIME